MELIKNNNEGPLFSGRPKQNYAILSIINRTGDFDILLTSDLYSLADVNTNEIINFDKFFDIFKALSAISYVTVLMNDDTPNENEIIETMLKLNPDVVIHLFTIDETSNPGTMLGVLFDMLGIESKNLINV